MVGNSSDASSLFASSATGVLRLVIYLIIAIGLMVADFRGAYLKQIRYHLSALASPVYWLASSPARGLRNARLAFVDRQALAEENRTLGQELLFAKASLARMNSLAEQNNRLRELLQVRQGANLSAQIAEVVDLDLDPFRHRLMIGSGAEDGVSVGLAVTDAHGVLGQVSRVYPSRAEVILITDASHALPVSVVRTGLRAIAYGSGDFSLLELPHIPFSADVQVGDKLVTSGIGDRFPGGLSVATITSVKVDDIGTFAIAHATPSAKLDRSEEVLLLHERAADGSQLTNIESAEVKANDESNAAIAAPTPSEPVNSENAEQQPSQTREQQ